MRKRKEIALLLVICLVLWCVPLVSAEEDPFAGLWDRIDGSTATMPLVQAMRAHFEGGEPKVEHSTTPDAYMLLCASGVDLIFVTPPSPEDLAIAQAAGVELEVFPVTREALVFLNNVQNPVQFLSLQELRDIYAGRIINWSGVGGEDAAILPFQRELRSGSQTLFLACLMGEEEPMAPTKEVVAGSMGKLIEEVASYNSAPNALGYSVFYYATRMYMSENIRLLAVDGILPSAQTIADGTYPLCTNYYAVLRKDTAPDDPARQLVAWLLGEEGQRVAVAAGYVAMGAEAPDEADAQERARTHMSSGTGGARRRTHVFCDHDPDDFEWGFSEIPEGVLDMAEAWWAQAFTELYGEEDYEEYEVYEDYDGDYAVVCSEILSMWMVGDEDEEGRVLMRTAVIDIEQERFLKLSDLFYDGVNYIDYINRHILFSPEFLLHWDEKGIGTEYGRYDTDVFSGLPNDYPYFVFWGPHAIGLLYDDSMPFWQSGWDEFGPASAFVPLHHWISPWGGCTVDVRYQDHMLPQGVAFPVPTLFVDGGHVPEAEAKINAALAGIAQRHIAQADSWARNAGWVRVEAEIYGHYAVVDFCFGVRGERVDTQARGILSLNAFDLHTGAYYDTEAIFERWRDSPQAMFVERLSWEEPSETLPGYRLPEDARPSWVSVGCSDTGEVTLDYYFRDISEGWFWMKVPMTLLEEEGRQTEP